MDLLVAVNEVFIGLCFLWVGVSIGNFALTSKLLKRYVRKLSVAGRPLLMGKVMSILGIIFLSYITCGFAHILHVLSEYDAAVSILHMAVLFICSVVSMLTAGILTIFLPKVRELTDKLELTEEGKLQDVENQFLEVIEACQQSITKLSPDLTFIKGNGPSKAFFGADFIGKPILDFVHGEDRETLLQATRSVLHRSGFAERDIEANIEDSSPPLNKAALGQLTVEYRVRSPRSDPHSADKIWIWVESKVVYQSGVGSSRGHFMMLSRNVDAKKEKEVLFLEKQRAQEHENAAKLNYITCTAHDLKTPLQSFIFALDLMEQLGPLSTEQKEVLMHARMSYSLMSLTIQQTMDSSKVLMGGKLVPHKQSVKLSDIIFKVSAIIDSYTRQVPIVFRLSTQMCNTIITDEEWLWQMLLNLLTNACKFTSTGSIVVDIHLSDRSSETSTEVSSSSKDSMILFKVSDTGVGVAENNAVVLFNVFSQAQAGQLSGTGLGLFGIRVRTEGLNGLYGMHNRTDGECGSVFWFKVPYVADITHGDTGSAGTNTQLSNQTALSVKSATHVRNSFSSTDGSEFEDHRVLLGAFDGFLSSVFKSRVKPRLDGVNRISVELPVLVDEERVDNRNSDTGGSDASDFFAEVLRPGEKSAATMTNIGKTGANSLSIVATSSREQSSVFRPFRFSMTRTKIQPLLDNEATEFGYNENSVELRAPELANVIEECPRDRGLIAFVVDDSPSIRKLMKRTLEKQGVSRVELFENGDLALQAMMRKEVDVVFMDIQMPVMSGPEAVRRFRNFEKSSGRMCRQLVVAASANFSIEAEREYLGEDMFDALYSKPLQTADIKCCLEKCRSRQLDIVV